MSPQDDVASFSIAQKLNSKLRGLAAANLNINQGKGLFETISSGINSQIEVVQKMRELAIRASSSLLSSNDRENLQTELQSLRDSFDQIVDSTQFNDQKVLKGDLGDQINLQVGDSINDLVSFNLTRLRSTDVFQTNQGTALFTESASSSIYNASRQAEAGDFDGDGNLDYIASSQGTVAGIDLVLGDGSGGIKRRVQITDAEQKNNDTTIGDFNNDGLLDFATADRDSDSISIYLGNGDGSFQSRFTYAEGDRALRVVTGDFDGDGIIDLAALVGTSSSEIHIHLGNGDGTFGESITTTVNSYAGKDLAAGDFNNDGIDDLAVSTSQATIGSYFKTFLSNGDGSFQQTTSLVPGANSDTIGVEDLNNDGYLDIITIGGTSVIGDPSLIEIFLGDGTGSYTVSKTVGLSDKGNGSQIRFGDFNGDGIKDIAYANSLHAGVRLGLGDGDFSSSDSFLYAGSTQNIAVGDFNNDGVDDFAFGSDTDDTMRIYLNHTKLASALSDFDVMTSEKAQNLIDILDGALEKLLGAQTEVASNLTRLESAANLNLLFSDSIENARSLVEDVDVSTEIANLVQQQILQQSQVAVLAQANINAQVVLGLLDSLN